MEYVFETEEDGEEISATFKFKIISKGSHIVFDIYDTINQSAHCSNISPKRAREIADALYEVANDSELSYHADLLELEDVMDD